MRREEYQPLCIRRRSHKGLYWESEGFKVLFEDRGQHNPYLREGTLLCLRNRRVEDEGDCDEANNP